MARPNPERLLKRSFAWVQQHPEASNLDVPDDLLAAWTFDVDDYHDERRPEGFHLSVFSFGYMLTQVGAAAGGKVSVSLLEILDLFRKWQLKLALAQVHRVTEIKSARMPLFRFPSDEAIEYWTEAGGQLDYLREPSGPKRLTEKLSSRRRQTEPD